MHISKLFILVVCSISILHIHPVYSKSKNESERSILEESTDLRNIQEITQGLFQDIIQNIPIHLLKESIVFIPQVKYTSNNISIRTVFDSVFTQTLIATFTKHGVPIASYADKKKILVEYEKSLQQKLQEKNQIEKKITEEIQTLQTEIIEKKQHILFIERELENTQQLQKEQYKIMINTKNASRSLIDNYEKSSTREAQYSSDIYSLEDKNSHLQKEINSLTSALTKINQEIDTLYNTKKETSNSEEEEKNDTQKQNDNDKTNEDLLREKESLRSKIKVAIESREKQISEINTEISQKKAEISRIQEKNPTIKTGIEQSKARILELEKDYNSRAQEIDRQRQNIQKEKTIIHSLESKIIALKNMNTVLLPKIYEIKISYSNAESVLFITAEVSSGMHNNIIYLSQHVTRMTPYTAMLLQQEPLYVKPYTIRSVIIQKPKSQQPRTISNERGLH